MGEGLVMDESALSRRADRFLIQARGLSSIPAQAGELSANQGGPVGEVLRTTSGPDLQMAVVFSNGPEVLRPALGRRAVAGARVRQPSEEVVLGSVRKTLDG